MILYKEDFMKQKIGEEYYTLVGKKDVEKIKPFLHEEVELYSPLASVRGKSAVAESTGHFMQAIQSLKIRSSFGNPDQAMIVYEVDMPGVSSHFAGASLLTFREGKIVRIDLFYDSRPVLHKKEEIFDSE